MLTLSACAARERCPPPAPVTFSANSTGNCDQPGALCTADGDPLSARAQASVGGPVIMSLAGPAGVAPYGYVPEGQPLVFTVNLREPTSDSGGAEMGVNRIVTVHYETRDYTATALGDYTSMSGTLIFPWGVTEKTISVPTIDDGHDDNGEAMYLWLTNATGGAILPGRSLSARGPIGNTDPMPKAWLGRFGRTVAEQVVGAVTDRVSAPREPATTLTLAGQRVEPLGADREPFEDATASRSLSSRDVLQGTAFALSGRMPEGSSGAIWGRGTLTSFEGREGAVAVDGDVQSAMVGADFSSGPAMGGLLVAVSQGDGGSANSAVSSTLTGVYPYGRYEVNEHLSAWAVAGYGEGELMLTPQNAPKLKTDINLTMAGGGLASTVLDGGDDGLSLVLIADGLAARTSSEAGDGNAGKLAASSATVTRFRLGVDTSGPGVPVGTGTLVPSIEIGVRHDGGDAERGFGAEIGAGLAWSDPVNGISADLQARGLLTHEDRSFRERGVSASLGWNPQPETGRGPSLTLSHSHAQPQCREPSDGRGERSSRARDDGWARRGRTPWRRLAPA